MPALTTVRDAPTLETRRFQYFGGATAVAALLAWLLGIESLDFIGYLLGLSVLSFASSTFTTTGPVEFGFAAVAATMAGLLGLRAGDPMLAVILNGMALPLVVALDAPKLVFVPLLAIGAVLVQWASPTSTTWVTTLDLTALALASLVGTTSVALFARRARARPSLSIQSPIPIRPPLERTPTNPRRQLLAALEETLRRPGDHLCALILVEVERFDYIRAGLMVPAQEAMVEAIARRLVETASADDLVMHLEAGRFAVLVSQSDDVAHSSALVERLQAAVSRPIQIDAHEAVSTTRAAVVRGSRATVTAEEMLRDAELAVASGERGRHAGPIWFEPDMRGTLTKRIALERDLRHAVDRKEISLRYQPIVSVEQPGRWLGLEALLRWNHPTRGPIQPVEFVALAEESGLIVDLGRWVLREAMTMAAQLLALRLTDQPLMICVNVSPVQLADPNFVQTVTETLEETRFPPTQLGLEITENALVSNLAAAAAKLSALRGLGVAVLVDDFGTGYSALSYLHDLPVDFVKLDRSFIARLGSSAQATAMLNGIVALAAGVGVEVVAEGVETLAQLEAIRRAGCRRVQGFFTGRPASSHEIEYQIATLQDLDLAKLTPDSDTPEQRRSERTWLN